MRYSEIVKRAVSAVSLTLLLSVGTMAADVNGWHNPLTGQKDRSEPAGHLTGGTLISGLTLRRSRSGTCLRAGIFLKGLQRWLLWELTSMTSTTTADSTC